MTETKNEKWVLIVEDEKPLLRVIQDRFESSGFDTLTARSCDQAIDYLESTEGCSAAWLDHYLLGEGTGLDLIVKIKESPKFSQVPIFIVTNTGLHDKEQTYMALGATKYFIKSNHKLDQIIQTINDSVENGL